MSQRLVMALISSTFEEAALAAVVLMGLPELGIVLPVWALALLMVLLAVNNALFYWIGGRALKKPHLRGLPDMVGTVGVCVEQIAPRGLVSIRSELWQAKTAGSAITSGRRVIVTQQDSLILTVHPEVEDADDG